MWPFNPDKANKTEVLLRELQKPKSDYFSLGQIQRHFDELKEDDFRQIISDKTNKDLDLDDVFMYVDRTISKVGQQYLYSTLRTLQKNPVRSQKLESLVSMFDQEPELSKMVIRELSLLQNSDAFGIVSLLKDQKIQRPSWYWVIKLLSIVSVLCLCLSIFLPWLILLLIPLFAANTLIHFWNKGNVYQYAGTIPQLIILTKISKVLSSHKGLKGTFKNIDNAISTSYATCSKMSLFRLEAKIQDDMTMIADSLLEFVKIMFLLEPIFLFKAIKKIEYSQESLQEVFSFVGMTDSALSIWILRNSLDIYCIPNIVDDKQAINATNIYHPMILSCVKNTIVVGDKSVLLSGSNMSGKTSFIRSVGVNALLAQTINTCFADEFTIPPLNIHSAVRISDDLINEKSYYFEEVSVIKEMIDACDNDIPNLFLLDEIFKGTNTRERIGAGKAVLEYLSENNFVFVSTHDLELTNLLVDKYELYHFCESIENKNLIFDYTLKKGRLQQTNAIKILQMNGYPKNIIDEANKVVEHLIHIQPQQS